MEAGLVKYCNEGASIPELIADKVFFSMPSVKEMTISFNNKMESSCAD